MTLTDTERIILINQCEILRQLSAEQYDVKHYENAMEALERGYEELYAELLPTLDPPLEKDVYHVVRDILDVYSAIETYKERHPDDEEVRRHRASSFRGFSGNEETQYMSFAEFFTVKMDKYPDVVKNSQHEDFNSHQPMIPEYERMISVWETLHLEPAWDLSHEQVMQLLEA